MGGRGIARARVSLEEQVVCRREGGRRFTRLRGRYYPPPEIGRLGAVPGADLPQRRARSVSVPLSLARCGKNARALAVSGEVYAEIVNGGGLEGPSRRTCTSPTARATDQRSRS